MTLAPVPRLVLTLVAGLLGGTLIVVVAGVELTPRDQAIFATGTVLAALLCDQLGNQFGNRFGGRRISLVLIVLSLSVTLRYLFWRLTDSLQFESVGELALGTGLLLAELFAALALALGYLQTAWPLERPPLPMPPDPGDWPSVDVFIPTYNEGPRGGACHHPGRPGPGLARRETARLAAR